VILSCHMSKLENTPPPERKIGARIRIKPIYQAEAEAFFKEAGFLPIYKELRTDGNISYWFGKDQAGAFVDAGVLERLPLHWWAHYARVGGPPTIN
jgi:hypothetical protein